MRFPDHTRRRTTVGRNSLTSDKPVAETSNWGEEEEEEKPQHSQHTDIHAPGGIRIHSLSKRAAADLRFRPRGHWDRLRETLAILN